MAAVPLVEFPSDTALAAVWDGKILEVLDREADMRVYVSAEDVIDFLGWLRSVVTGE